jgi:cytochrome c oxidase subunit II
MVIFEAQLTNLNVLMNIDFSLMKKSLRKASILWIALFTLSISAQAALTITESITGAPVSEETVKAGAALFKSKCASCHELNNKLIGPALKDVTKRRTHEWLLSWIRNNEKFRKTGDADANAIYDEYKGSVMTAFEDLNDDQINSIIMYTENGELGVPPVTVEGGGTVAPVDPNTIKKTNWGLLVMCLLVGFIILMVIKILDLVGKLTGKEVIKWNNVNATLMLLFLVVGMSAAIWEYVIHSKHFLPESASEHGVTLDNMMTITFIITGIVFIITHILLFWFAFKYRQKKNVKALYYPDNDKLEMVWTIIPAIVLTVLVIGGLTAWQDITRKADKGTAEIELFAYQFGWTARYPGNDNVLGNANYNLISATNPLGVAVDFEAEALLVELDSAIADVERAILDLPIVLGNLKSTLGGLDVDARKNQVQKIADIENGSAENELRIEIRRKNTQITRIKAAMAKKTFFSNSSMDDIITDEIHLPVNKSIVLKLRGRDVIHSAYLPYFRAQMNVVPGLPTQFSFKPTITTAEMRKKLNDNEFDYHVVCNKICGNAHFNMKMKVVIESEKDYQIWLESKAKTFVKKSATEETAPAAADTTQQTAIKLENKQLALK